ncbi:hypothetical protein CEUSTIGMA_g4053.t1 [Chlamydomonas eustigma]|uniref:Uncharacterized protein n=1 Tax=Chlamydomonas eustigma TaxID=1157962 RepID=A0A250X0K7_9CHLO|nr:hypothetical protein CEUSTIGMA_g4053.t1 [Chlamydomonas eustigma]|eukprot:GAX76607.1 hypothetical protein CEUSTIGMA_g4053.t1 [Chlamydomonas eustigma]
MDESTELVKNIVREDPRVPAGAIEYLRVELQMQQRAIAQHFDVGSMLIGYSPSPGRLRGNSAPVKRKEFETVGVQVLESLVGVSDALNLEHASFELRKALKMQEIAESQTLLRSTPPEHLLIMPSAPHPPDPPSHIQQSLPSPLNPAEQQVLQDIQAAVVPEALPSLLIGDQLMTQKQQQRMASRHLLSGSAAASITAGVPHVLAKKPPKTLWGNLPGLSKLQPPPGSPLSRLRSPVGGRRILRRKESLAPYRMDEAEDDENEEADEETEASTAWTPPPASKSWHDLVKERNHAAHLRRLVRMTTVRKVEFERNHAAHVIQAAWRQYKGIRMEKASQNLSKRLKRVVTKHREMEAALRAAVQATWCGYEALGVRGSDEIVALQRDIRVVGFSRSSSLKPDSVSRSVSRSSTLKRQHKNPSVRTVSISGCVSRTMSQSRGSRNYQRSISSRRLDKESSSVCMGWQASLRRSQNVMSLSRTLSFVEDGEKRTARLPGISRAGSTAVDPACPLTFRSRTVSFAGHALQRSGSTHDSLNKQFLSRASSVAHSIHGIADVLMKSDRDRRVSFAGGMLLHAEACRRSLSRSYSRSGSTSLSRSTSSTSLRRSASRTFSRSSSMAVHSVLLTNLGEAMAARLGGISRADADPIPHAKGAHQLSVEQHIEHFPHPPTHTAQDRMQTDGSMHLAERMEALNFGGVFKKKRSGSSFGSRHRLAMSSIHHTTTTTVAASIQYDQEHNQHGSTLLLPARRRTGEVGSTAPLPARRRTGEIGSAILPARRRTGDKLGCNDAEPRYQFTAPSYHTASLRHRSHVAFRHRRLATQLVEALQYSSSDCSHSTEHVLVQQQQQQQPAGTCYGQVVIESGCEEEWLGRTDGQQETGASGCLEVVSKSKEYDIGVMKGTAYLQNQATGYDSRTSGCRTATALLVDSHASGGQYSLEEEEDLEESSTDEVNVNSCNLVRLNSRQDVHRSLWAAAIISPDEQPGYPHLLLEVQKETVLDPSPNHLLLEVQKETVVDPSPNHLVLKTIAVSPNDDIKLESCPKGAWVADENPPEEVLGATSQCKPIHKRGSSSMATGIQDAHWLLEARGDGREDHQDIFLAPSLSPHNPPDKDSSSASSPADHLQKSKAATGLIVADPCACPHPAWVMAAEPQAPIKPHVNGLYTNTPFRPQPTATPPACTAKTCEALGVSLHHHDVIMNHDHDTHSSQLMHQDPSAAVKTTVRMRPGVHSSNSHSPASREAGSWGPPRFENTFMRWVPLLKEKSKPHQDGYVSGEDEYDIKDAVQDMMPSASISDLSTPKHCQAEQSPWQPVLRDEPSYNHPTATAPLKITSRACQSRIEATSVNATMSGAHEGDPTLSGPAAASGDMLDKRVAFFSSRAVRHSTPAHPSADFSQNLHRAAARHARNSSPASNNANTALDQQADCPQDPGVIQSDDAQSTESGCRGGAMAANRSVSPSRPPMSGMQLIPTKTNHCILPHHNGSNTLCYSAVLAGQAPRQKLGVHGLRVRSAGSSNNAMQHPLPLSLQMLRHQQRQEWKKWSRNWKQQKEAGAIMTARNNKEGVLITAGGLSCSAIKSHHKNVLHNTVDDPAAAAFLPSQFPHLQNMSATQPASSSPPPTTTEPVFTALMATQAGWTKGMCSPSVSNSSNNPLQQSSNLPACTSSVIDAGFMMSPAAAATKHSRTRPSPRPFLQMRPYSALNRDQ